MASNYLEIEAPIGSEKLIKQDFKFKTGRFLWKIKFTAPLNPATVNNNNLYVTDEKGALLSTKIRYNAESNCIEIEPTSAYSTVHFYTLNITRNVESRGGQRLKSEMKIKFKFR